MECLDENFEPVTQHDVSEPTVELVSMDHGQHVMQCLLCGSTETHDFPADLILSARIEPGLGGMLSG